MRVALGVRRDERPADFEVVVELSVGVFARSGGCASHLAVDVGVDLQEAFVRDFASFSQTRLLLVELLGEDLDELVFEGLLAAGVDGFGLDFFLDAFVVDVVDQQLVGVLVVVDEFELSVGLVCEDSVSSACVEVQGDLDPGLDGVGVSEADEELLFELLVSVEVLLEVSGEVAVGLDDWVRQAYVAGTSGGCRASSRRRSSLASRPSAGSGRRCASSPCSRCGS